MNIVFKNLRLHVVLIGSNLLKVWLTYYFIYYEVRILIDVMYHPKKLNLKLRLILLLN